MMLRTHTVNGNRVYEFALNQRDLQTLPSALLRTLQNGGEISDYLDRLAEIAYELEQQKAKEDRARREEEEYQKAKAGGYVEEEYSPAEWESLDAAIDEIKHKTRRDAADEARSARTCGHPFVLTMTCNDCYRYAARLLR